jgi:hypothetical protein
MASGITFTSGILWILANGEDIKAHNIKFVILNMLKHSAEHILGGDMFHCTLYAVFLAFIHPLSKGCHLDVVGGPSTPHDPESDAGGSLSSWQGHPSR